MQYFLLPQGDWPVAEFRCLGDFPIMGMGYLLHNKSQNGRMEEWLKRLDYAIERQIVSINACRTPLWVESNIWLSFKIVN